MTSELRYGYQAGDFAGLRAVVTGAGSGIGHEAARQLLLSGASVAGLDLKTDTITAGADPIAVDVSDGRSVEDAVGTAADQLGGIDIVLNCAGVGAAGPVDATSDDEWARVLQVNVIGTARVVRAALPHLRLSAYPAIVNIASLYATTGLKNRACYGASKGAVASLTMCMAADLVEEGIRVNCISPGATDTAFAAEALRAAADPAAARATLEAGLPLGRMATAGEQAAALLFLAHPASSYITGVNLSVDGGMSTVRVPARPAMATS